MDLLSAMEVYVRVAECRSFSRAAESLDQANAATTTWVRNLERHLGVTLINRDTRRFGLTEEGQAYLLHAREILARVARADDEVRRRAGRPAGRLHLQASVSLGSALLCPRLPDFAKAYPGIRTSLSLGSAAGRSTDQAFDVALRLDATPEPDLLTESVCESAHVVCFAPSWKGVLPPHPRDIEPRACIGVLQPGQPASRPWEFIRGDESVQVRPGGALHFNSGHDALAAALAGVGVACVLDLLACHHLRSGALVRAYADWQMPVRVLHFVSPRSRAGSPQVRAFTEFFGQSIGRHGGHGGAAM
ncbi:LysR family transcriptional regulator [Xylophilus sp. GOD-11R]|uniref:LysR family transcriptional regulator n=1 Tax=Xylophilus sp. GOD-11R TaxID=3089814 RepID=UPI00298CC47E|nr:LysR family transcriptional regulator [Xylophilus sp. GOD-11R]WPB55923.1 LysR family transcriptional regulator [Xylophilus sp. GOD-11R]